MKINFPWKTEEGLRGTAYAVGLVTFLFLVILLIFLILHNSVGEEDNRDLVFQLEQMSQTALQELDGITDDLRYLSHLPLSSDLIRNPEVSYDPNLISLVESMMLQDRSYDQVRILDRQGMERFRMNLDPALGTVLVPQDELQDKSDRYYVTDSLALTNDEIYVSPFDLNMEQGVIEQPIKPMLRFGVQIHDENEEILGIVIINYLGQHLIDRISPTILQEGSTWYLLNHRGDYLNGPSEEKEWAFMYGREDGFSVDFPIVWNSFTGDGIYDSPDKGSFYCKTIALIEGSNAIDDTNQLCLILHKEPKSLSPGEEILLTGIIICFLLIAPILSLVGMRLGKGRYREEQHLRDIEKLASHDSLTGLMNRRAIYEILSKEIKLAHREKLHHSVGYIDVNNLKETNDREGHDAGDVLITKAAEALRRTIRETDTAARIGGDEFLVSFPHCKKNESLKVLERASAWYEQEGIKYTGSPWSLSYGTAEYRHEDDSINELINRADQEMYKAKSRYKKAKEKTE